MNNERPGDQVDAILVEISQILDAGRPAPETVRAVRRALEGPALTPQPIKRDERNWPLLGSACEWHDDLAMP